MKTKNSKHQSHYRLHHRGLMYFSVAVLLFCVLKFDSHVFSVFKQAYNQGMGIAATFIREGEMTRHHIDFGNVRMQTISGS
ncbi:MAG TPA: hypothetical protein VJR27_03820 [Candidatus Saccharimonadales bacterium]|nr:hypothetical protein [Candidatus Saccharimonadales bacterium]